MLKPEVKAKWINALRSDQYAQTTHCLRDEIGYCCLGVLTDIYISEQENAFWDIADKEYKEMLGLEDRDTVYEFDGNAEMIGNEVYKWACEHPHSFDELAVFIKDKQINLGYQDQSIEPHKTTLQELNDRYLYTFSHIADVIEEQL